jgi:hypothetical protein
MILLLSVVSGVFGASVAVDLVDSSAQLDNVTNVDNSTSKSLNVSESISALKIREVDVQFNVTKTFIILFLSVCNVNFTFVTPAEGVSVHLHQCD